MKKLVIRLFLGLVVIPASVLAVVYSLNRNGFFDLKVVELKVVSDHADPHFLKPLLSELESKVNEHQGTSLWKLSLKEVTNQILNRDWVESVRVLRQWPDAIRVEINTKKVELIYLNSQGVIYPVVESGAFLKPVMTSFSPNVAILQGSAFEKNQEMRKKAVEAIQQIPKEGKFSRERISSVQFDQKNGFWFTLIQSGLTVKLGEEKIGLKAARVSQVMEYIDRRELEARVIDANLSKKVLVRLRKDP